MEPIHKRKVWGGARGWCTKLVRASFGVGIWKVIRKEWEVVARRVVFEVGDGARVLCWKEKWCGMEPLCVAFPTIFTIAATKNALVKEVWRTDVGRGGWNPLFFRPLMNGKCRRPTTLCCV